MKIGIFDSGLGGLIVAHSLVSALPSYDYLYLGDTARVPYGNRSQEVIYDLTKNGVKYLLEHDCQLVIIACNTASAEALSHLQRDYIPQYYPERRVLGVLIPTAEETVTQTKNGRIGIIATRGTVDSGAYPHEIHKLNPSLKVFQQPAPLLVPLVENGALQYADAILSAYLRPLVKEHIDTLVLGCTHYPVFKPQLQKQLGPAVTIVSQTDFLAEKLAAYLKRHPELDHKLTKNGTHQFVVTDLTPGAIEMGKLLFNKVIDLQKAEL